MKTTSRWMMWSVLAGGLSVLAACGGAEQDMSSDVAQVTAAQTECRNDVRQFNSCVHQANLIGLAQCNAGETRTTYSLLSACSSNTYRAITWTCCPQ